MTDEKWVRHRFRANDVDYRPMKWPPPGPYWCTGYGNGYSTVIAYAPDGQDIREWWPEATDIDSDLPGALVFSDRFPEPEWWKEMREPDDDVDDGHFVTVVLRMNEDEAELLRKVDDMSHGPTTVQVIADPTEYGGQATFLVAEVKTIGSLPDPT